MKPSAVLDHRATGVVLLQLLATDLRRRHWRVAIRRFLMRVACGVDVPESSPKAACEALLLACPARDLRRILDGVQSWLDMLHPSFEHLQREAVPVDECAHPHALSRRPGSVRAGVAASRLR
jgi:hypothetical protein